MDMYFARELNVSDAIFHVSHPENDGNEQLRERIMFHNNNHNSTHLNINHTSTANSSSNSDSDVVETSNGGSRRFVQPPQHRDEATTTTTTTKTMLMVSKSLDYSRMYSRNSKDHSTTTTPNHPMNLYHNYNNINRSNTTNTNINVQHRIMNYRRRQRQQVPSQQQQQYPLLPQQQHPSPSFPQQQQQQQHQQTNVVEERGFQTTISYAGYLLKRSNRPYSDYDNNNNNHNHNDDDTCAYDTDNTIVELPPHDPANNNTSDDHKHGPTARPTVTTTTTTTTNTGGAVSSETRATTATTANEGGGGDVVKVSPTAPDVGDVGVDDGLDFIGKLFGIDLSSATTTTTTTTTTTIPPNDIGNHSSSSSNQNINDSNNNTLSTNDQLGGTNNVPSHPQQQRGTPATATTTSRSSSSIPIRINSNDPPTAATAIYHDKHSSRRNDATTGNNFDTSSCNIIDPNDSHIWRRKYCVLEGNVLYFYSHQTVAESLDATLERQQSQFYSEDDDHCCNDDDDDDDADDKDDDIHTSTAATTQQRRQQRKIQTSEYNKLSQSPLPIRPTILLNGIGATSTTTSHVAASSNFHFWEKRVELQYVGSVRSVELEYGSHAIELSASSIRSSGSSSSSSNDFDDAQQEENTDVYDRLVLRASNNDEMKEWLFQFLLCIASFVMDMVATRCSFSNHPPIPTITTTTTTTAGDLITCSDIPQPPLASTNQGNRCNYSTTNETVPPPHRNSDWNVIDSSSSGSPRHYLSTAVANQFISTNNHHHNNNISRSFSYGSQYTPLSHGHGRDSILLNRRRRRRGDGLLSQQQQQQQQQPVRRNDDSSLLLDPFISPTSAQLERVGGETTTTATTTTTSSRIVTPMIQLDHRQERPMSPDDDMSHDEYGSVFVMDSQSPAIATVARLHSADCTTTTMVPLIPIDSLAATTWQTANIIDESTPTVVPKLEFQSPPSSSTKGKYIPPHLRNRGSVVSTLEGSASTVFVPLPSSSENGYGHNDGTSSTQQTNKNSVERMTDHHVHDMNHDSVKLGGCSDPNHVIGSIQDARNIPRKASQLGKVRTVPFGYQTPATNMSMQDLKDSPPTERQSRKLLYEIGAVSECGVRDYNEDSFLISSNLLQTFVQYEAKDETLGNNGTIWNRYSTDTSSHHPSLFAIFDGHCGDHASRFSAEELTRFMHIESLNQVHENDDNGTAYSDQLHTSMINIIERAISKMDEKFCRLCVQDGREWESGSTALIASLIDERLIIANLGDARGIIGRSIDISRNDGIVQYTNDGWSELPQNDLVVGGRRYIWKEVTNVHSPNRDDERARIERAGGWVTTECEIPIAQLKRMELDDDDVVDILHRCFAHRYDTTNNTTTITTSTKASAPHRVLQISRVCGILGVSRAIGDRDLKASSYHETDDTTTNQENDATTGGTRIDSHNRKSVSDDEQHRWDSSHLGLMYPEDHDQSIVGNLISNKPEFHTVRVGEAGVNDEFLLLACDGLWDVLDPDDAYRITRDLLFEKQWSAKKTAGRLSELALHLGSSDNVTVIIVRFFRELK